MSQGSPSGIHHQFQKQMNRLPKAISSVLQQCPRSAQAGAGGAEPQQLHGRRLLVQNPFSVCISHRRGGLRLTRSFEGHSMNSCRMFSHSSGAGAGRGDRALNPSTVWLMAAQTLPGANPKDVPRCGRGWDGSEGPDLLWGGAGRAKGCLL